MQLNDLKPAAGAKKTARRVGRGFTRGKTCQRGHKGYKSRSGSSVPAAFEGGQMPLQRRLPKHGFKYVHSKRSFTELSLYRIVLQAEKLALSTLHIDIEWLHSLRLIKKHVRAVKIIGPANTSPNTLKTISLGDNITATASVTKLLVKEAS